ncbi:MAG: InlB B-repeat-containing protein [Clostridia bacterium]|nr:InlB B-repeat-containing protein [Clostridia bacterium]
MKIKEHVYFIIINVLIMVTMFCCKVNANIGESTEIYNKIISYNDIEKASEDGVPLKISSESFYENKNYALFSNNISSVETDKKLNDNNGEVVIDGLSDNSDGTFSCNVNLPEGSTYVTVSVTGGKFIMPIDDSELYDNGIVFSYGINISADTLLENHNAGNEYNILTFKLTDVTAAGKALSTIKYTKTAENTELKISTTTVDLNEDTDIFFGHIYQIKTQSESSWPQAVIDAHNSVIKANDGTGENGYLVTVTSINENKMLLKMIQKSAGNYTHTWIGGTSNYRDSEKALQMDYEYLKNMAENGISISSYFNDDTMKKSTSEGHNGLMGEDFYWIDGPEKGDSLPNGGEFWCSAEHNQWNSDEPNNGHVVWTGYGGPYWDDMNLNQVNLDNPTSYIVEYGGKINQASTESTPITNAEAYTNIKIITITFDDNKTKSSQTNKTICKGDTVELPVITRAGYIFLGWSKYKDKPIILESEDNKYVPSDNITLYAQWEPLIKFEAVTDSGIYNINSINSNVNNASYGAVSFNFRVTDYDKEFLTESLSDTFKSFYIRINENDDILFSNGVIPSYDDYNNNIKTEDKEGYWMHCIIEQIPEDSYDTLISAVPYAVTNEGEIIMGDIVYNNVNSFNLVIKDW